MSDSLNELMLYLQQLQSMYQWIIEVFLLMLGYIKNIDGVRLSTSALQSCFDIVLDEFKSVPSSLRRDTPLRGSWFPGNKVVWKASHYCRNDNFTIVAVHLYTEGLRFDMTQQKDSVDGWQTYIFF